MITNIIKSAAIILALTAAPVMAQASQAPADARPAGSMTILIAGDLLGPYKTPLDINSPGWAGIMALIRKSDAAFANQEGNSFALPSYKGSIAAENGGGYPLHSLETMRQLRATGLNLISRANNHATDYGIEGLTATDITLDAIGFTRAGTGQSLTEARKAGYRDTPAGRLALVATASTFTGMSPAGDSARGVGPRPGLNPLRVEPVTLVSRKEMQVLRRIVVRGGWQGYDAPAPNPAEVHLNGQLYRVDAKPGLTYTVDLEDRSALLAEVAEARSKAGQVLFSIHAHETLSGDYEDPNPAAFLPSLFHDAIDAGATIVARHGPHSVQGIEIYKGWPIFYGLGHFFFELPREIKIASGGPTPIVIRSPINWWDGAVATVRYAEGKLAEIRVYPLAIESNSSPTHGLPTLARGARANEILTRIRDRSVRYGTKLRIEGDVGVIDIPTAPQQ